MSKATGMSTGRAMGEWLGDTLEGAEAMAGLVERARQSPIKAAREMNAYALGLADMTEQLIETVKGGSGRRAGWASGAPSGAASDPFTPPPSNTGGKVPEQGKKLSKGSK